MEQPPPPPQPHLAAIPPIIPTTISTIPIVNNHPNSTDSSPRSHHHSEWDHQESLPPIPGAKLRLMCSYGGRIIPRPHDKTLCYVGGETRIVVLDRHSSLADITARLSRNLLNGRGFALKYQLPTEDLDSLVSVTTDEDLENMIEEYDRTLSKPNNSRLRLFLLLAKPESAISMGTLLEDAKSETWFVDALNGVGLLPRGLSDSAAIDDLLSLHNDSESPSQKEVLENSSGATKEVLAKNELHGVENSDSCTSSPSNSMAANLPPIGVRVEEQFAQLSVHAGYENTNPRVFSDDERSDRGGVAVPTAASGFKKPPLPLPLPLQGTVQHKLAVAFNLPSPDSKVAAGGGCNLPSPDSVASDINIASASSYMKPASHQDLIQTASTQNIVSTKPTDMLMDNSALSSQNHTPPVQDPGYVLPQQLDYSDPQPQQQQQQFVQANMNVPYIHQHPTIPAPISSYYPVYPAPTQQSLHLPIDQQYPMYLLPVSNVVDATAVASSRPMAPPNPAIYTSKAVTMAIPTTPALVPATQFQQQQQQYIGFSHQLPNTNYGYEYMHPPAAAQCADQVYYTGQPAVAAPPTLPPQYQTMNVPAAAVLLAEATLQLSADGSNKQQTRTSPPV
ncbi:hypothetical protein Ancab_038667 [Ancistrocladus abbreviatus]